MALALLASEVGSAHGGVRTSTSAFFFIQMLISDCSELDIVLPSLGTEISAVPLLHSVTLGEIV